MLNCVNTCYFFHVTILKIIVKYQLNNNKFLQYEYCKEIENNIICMTVNVLETRILVLSE